MCMLSVCKKNLLRGVTVTGDLPMNSARVSAPVIPVATMDFKQRFL